MKCDELSYYYYKLNRLLPLVEADYASSFYDMKDFKLSGARALKNHQISFSACISPMRPIFLLIIALGLAKCTVAPIAADSPVISRATSERTISVAKCHDHSAASATGTKETKQQQSTDQQCSSGHEQRERQQEENQQETHQQGHRRASIESTQRSHAQQQHQTITVIDASVHHLASARVDPLSVAPMDTEDDSIQNEKHNLQATADSFRRLLRHPDRQEQVNFLMSLHQHSVYLKRILLAIDAINICDELVYLVENSNDAQVRLMALTTLRGYSQVR
jgi:hypothetical protein